MVRIDFARFVGITASLAAAELGACASGTPPPTPAPIVATAPEVEVPDASATDDEAAGDASVVGPGTGGGSHGEDPGVEGDMNDRTLTDPSGELGVPIGGLVGGGSIGSGSGSVGALGHGRGSASGSPVGHLEPAVIQKAVRANVGKIKACYEAELKTDPTFETKVVVTFVIGAQGAVSSASLRAPSGKVSFDSCVLATTRRMRFPAPDGGVVTVSYPFVFKAS